MPKGWLRRVGERLMRGNNVDYQNVITETPGAAAHNGAELESGSREMPSGPVKHPPALREFDVNGWDEA